MSTVTVKILGIVATQQHGTLSSGDLLTTDAAFARHLVEDCAAAEYVTTAPKAPAPKRPTKKDAVK